MALGGANIGTFDATIPAGSESVGLGDDRIRSTKTVLQQAFDSEHVFASNGGVVGQHRAGSARAFYGPTSQLSASDTSTVANGRLMVTSDTTRLYSVNSLGASLLGAGPGALSVDTTAGMSFGAPAQNTRWAMEMGLVASPASIHTVTFPNSGFSGLPFLQTSVYTQVIGSNDPGRVLKLQSLSATQFVVQVVLGENGDADTAGIMWMSVGTRAL